MAEKKEEEKKVAGANGTNTTNNNKASSGEDNGVKINNRNGYDVATMTDVTNTKREPKTSVTEKQDQVVTKEEVNVGPSGEELRRYQETIITPLANAYGIDPKTGKFVGRVSELLGFDPKVREEQLKKQEELARFKQKEVSWKNALGVITDIVTAATGGNVYKRDKDNISAQEKEKADKARDAIRSIADAIPTAKKQREMQYAQAEQEKLEKFLEKNRNKITRTTTQGGGSVTTESGGNTKVTSTKHDVIDPNKKGGGKVLIGSRYYDPTTQVRIRELDGSYRTFDADTKEAVSYARLAISRMSQWLNENRDKKDSSEYKTIYSALSNAGITDPLSFDPNNDNITGDDYLRFLQNAQVFTIDEVQTELEKLFEKSTGKKLVLKKVPKGQIGQTTKEQTTKGQGKGWGSVPQEGTPKQTDDAAIYN